MPTGVSWPPDPELEAQLRARHERKQRVVKARGAVVDAARAWHDVRTRDTLTRMEADSHLGGACDEYEAALAALQPEDR